MPQVSGRWTTLFYSAPVEPSLQCKQNRFCQLLMQLAQGEITTQDTGGDCMGRWHEIIFYLPVSSSVKI
jgi:hypothetical protein